jgi:hypothetical protein
MFATAPPPLLFCNSYLSHINTPLRIQLFLTEFSQSLTRVSIHTRSSQQLWKFDQDQLYTDECGSLKIHLFIIEIDRTITKMQINFIFFKFWAPLLLLNLLQYSLCCFYLSLIEGRIVKFYKFKLVIRW